MQAEKRFPFAGYGDFMTNCRSYRTVLGGDVSDRLTARRGYGAGDCQL